MNAYKDWKEGYITQAEYNSIRRQEAYEYEQYLEERYTEEEEEDE